MKYYISISAILFFSILNCFSIQISPQASIPRVVSSDYVEIINQSLVVTTNNKNYLLLMIERNYKKHESFRFHTISQHAINNNIVDFNHPTVIWQTWNHSNSKKPFSKYKMVATDEDTLVIEINTKCEVCDQGINLRQEVTFILERVYIDNKPEYLMPFPTLYNDGSFRMSTTLKAKQDSEISRYKFDVDVNCKLSAFGVTHTEKYIYLISTPSEPRCNTLTITYNDKGNRWSKESKPQVQ